MRLVYAPGGKLPFGFCLLLIVLGAATFATDDRNLKIIGVGWIFFGVVGAGFAIYKKRQRKR